MANYIGKDERNKNLIFKRKLCPSHIIHQLNVPERVIKGYPIYNLGYSNSRDFTCYDRKGRPWPFKLSIRRSPVYSKPYFVKSVWEPFVVSKGLRAGDEVEFYTVKDNPGAGIQVRAWRKEPGLGPIIWRHVEDIP